MTEFCSPVNLPHIPDDLSIPQFIFRTEYLGRPHRSRNIPFFIEDGTGNGITYEQAHYRAYGLANALSIRWNISSGDVVCIFSPNDIDYATAIWGVQILGGIVTPANPSYTAAELQHQLSLSKAKLVIAHPACVSSARKAIDACGMSGESLLLLDRSPKTPSKIPTVEEAVSFGWSKSENYKAIRFLPGEAWKTIAFLSFSSGTTGKPKAVAISHYSIIANVIQMAKHYRLDEPHYSHKSMIPGDIAMGVLPFFHIYGLVVTMHYVLYAGGSILVVPKFNFKQFLNSITRYRVTHLYIVPPMCVLLTKHPEVKGRNFDHVKLCMSGAAPLGGNLMSQMALLFPNASIGQGYGLTETATTICSIQSGRKMGTIGSAGGLLPGIVAKVVKPDGSLASEGEPGELVVTGPAMAMGYYENPAATAETFVDGWVRTGDEVMIKDLEVFVLDRMKEIMKVRGFQVAPAELEAHLLLCPDVGDACVVGVPDEYSGELPLAFIVPSQDVLSRINRGLVSEINVKQAIAKHVSDAKIQYKWLTGGIEFIDAIPKNPSGKILRRILRDKAKTMNRNDWKQSFEPREAKL